jgi:hypothetical protein
MSKITFQLKKNKQKNNIKFVNYAYIYQKDEQIERSMENELKELHLQTEKIYLNTNFYFLAI